MTDNRGAFGLDVLINQIKDTQSAIDALRGNLCEIKYDPTDSASIELVIQEMERVIDNIISPYGKNPFVGDIADSAKDEFRRKLRASIK